MCVCVCVVTKAIRCWGTLRFLDQLSPSHLDTEYYPSTFSKLGASQRVRWKLAGKGRGTTVFTLL